MAIKLSTSYLPVFCLSSFLSMSQMRQSGLVAPLLFSWRRRALLQGVVQPLLAALPSYALIPASFLTTCSLMCARRTWQTVAVGASVPDATLAFVQSFGLLDDPVEIRLVPGTLPPALRHRAVLLPPSPNEAGGAVVGAADARLAQQRALSALCRVIRADLTALNGSADASGASARGLVFASRSAEPSLF